MKKILFTLITIVLLFSLVGCKNTLTAPDGLIAKAREEIPIAEADTIDIKIVDSIEKEDGNSLIWFMSGNEYQTHYYLPMECILKDNDKYEYVRVGKPVERGMDIVVYEWQGGYAFLINNEECKGIQITDGTGVVSRFMRKFDSGIWQKSITGGLRRPLGYVWAVGAQRVKGGGSRLSCP